MSEMKKYAIWKNHEVVGYINLTEDQKNQLNSIEDSGLYFGFDKNLKPENYDSEFGTLKSIVSETYKNNPTSLKLACDIVGETKSNEIETIHISNNKTGNHCFGWSVSTLGFLYTYYVASLRLENVSDKIHYYIGVSILGDNGIGTVVFRLSGFQNENKYSMFDTQKECYDALRSLKGKCTQNGRIYS